MSDADERNLTLRVDPQQFNQLLATLQSLVKVMATSQVKQDVGTEKNSRFLKVFGLTQTEIADVLGVTQPSVSEALDKSKARKRKTVKR